MVKVYKVNEKKLRGVIADLRQHADGLEAILDLNAPPKSTGGTSGEEGE